MKIRTTKKDEITNLLEELLTDIELDRNEWQQILLKTKRLLRLRPDIQIEKWIDLELFGYKNKEPFKKGTFSYKFMELTGRFSNFERTEGITSSFLSIDSFLDAEKTKLKLGNKNIYLSKNISIFSNLKGKIMALLHDYFTEIYYQIKYENVVESIFESYKQEIDKSIISESKEVIEMLPSVMDRLNENNTESISQALTTCRRIIDSFADVVFPAQDERVSLGNQELEVKKRKC